MTRRYQVEDKSQFRSHNRARASTRTARTLPARIDYAHTHAHDTRAHARGRREGDDHPRAGGFNIYPSQIAHTHLKPCLSHEPEAQVRDMAKHKGLSEVEEREVLMGISKSLPIKQAADYAGVEWVRLEALMRGDDELGMRLNRAQAREQARVLELMKMKSGDVKALAFLLERVYGLSAVEAKEVKASKVGGSQTLTVTPAVLKALSMGAEKLAIIKRN